MHSMKRLVLASCAMCAALSVVADARDGLRHWWKAKDLNGDGLLQPNELYDLMTVSAATPLTASSITQNTDSEMAVPASIGTGVTYASMRKTIADAEYFSLNNPTNYVDGALVANWQSITLPKAASLAVPSKGLEGTVIVRVKWHGCTSKKNNAGIGYQYSVTLFANNYWANGAGGWRIGLRTYDSSVSSQMYPAVCIGNSSGYTELSAYASSDSLMRVRKGFWHDIAFSFRRNDEDGKVYARFVVRNSDTSINSQGAANFPRHGVYSTSASVTPRAINAGAYPSYIGYNGMTTFASPLSRGEDTFGGEISDIKVYDHALTTEEALSEFVTENPLCEIGSANSSGNEFSDASPEQVYEPDTMAWGQMRKTLTTADPTLSVRLAVEENGHTLGRLVEFKSTPECAGTTVEVAANGRVFGRKAVDSDGWARFFLPGARMAVVAKDSATGTYPLLLTFTNKGKSPLIVDFLRVGGAWQLGKADGSSAEFGSNSAPYFDFCYYLGQNDISKLVSAFGSTVGSRASYMDFYFPLGTWAAKNLAHRLTLRTTENNGCEMSVGLNDAAEALHVFPIGSMYNAESSVVEIPSGTLLDDNHIRLYKSSNDAGWTNLDYWRFETVWTGRNYDDGTILIFR